MIAPTASPNARQPVFVVIAKIILILEGPGSGKLPAKFALNMVTKVSNAAAFDAICFNSEAIAAGIWRAQPCSDWFARLRLT
jgi:hypothetical protein